MKLLFITFSAFVITINTITAQTVNFTSSNLPVVIINTNGQEIPTEERIAAQMAIIWHEDGRRNFLSDSANNYAGRIEIELHGQSSLSFPKKSYRIETQDSVGENNNVSLLGMPSENDWILYAPYSDKSLIRNVLSYTLAAELGSYAPRVRFCELVLNDEYRGVYVLTERIKRDNDRVDITEMLPQDTAEPEISGGYIFKKDKTNVGDNIITLNRGLELVIIEPKNDEIVPLQTAWLKNHLNVVDNAITSAGNYAEYIDVQSFADNFLLVEWAKNIDGLRLSTYFRKDRNGRIVSGPIWDYNLALGNADYNDGWTPIGWYYDHIGWDNNWTLELLKDPYFNNLCIQRWKELRQTHFTTSNIFKKIDEWVGLLDEAQDRNFQKYQILGSYVWPNPGYAESGSYGFDAPKSGAPRTWLEEIAFLKDFIRDRLQWMDQEFGLQFIEISVDIQQKNWGHILYNNRIIKDKTFLGAFANDTLISLRAEAWPGYKFVRWEQIKTGDQSSAWINHGDEWKYLDNGSNLGTAWYDPEFDDSAWPEGPSELGYGDNDEATVVSYGPDAQNKYVTTYFRKHFNVTDANAYTELSLYLLRDDGAVVYLNGNEIVRSNMPQTDIYYNTYALDYVDGEGENTWHTYSPDPQLLTEGENVITVEIHQQNGGSSDISFDLRLNGRATEQQLDTMVVGYGEQLTYLPPAHAILRAVFQQDENFFSDVVINEIHYKPANGPDFEFIELFNIADSMKDLSGYYFTEGIEFTFPEATNIPGGGFILLARDSLSYNYLDCPVFQWSAGELADTGELLKLADPQDNTVDSVFYQAADPWPDNSAPSFSIELTTSAADNASALNWQLSRYAGGSPGMSNIRNINNLFINEFLASNQSVNTDNAGEHDDWIELYNANDQTVDVGGLYLSDDAEDPAKWKISDLSPYTTSIAADSFLIIWADEDSVQGLLHAGFQLSRSGEEITLSQIAGTDTIIIDQVNYPEQQTDVSMGRFPDGGNEWQFLYLPTPGYKNIVTTIDEQATGIKTFSLSQNYPNPFNPTTTIYYTVGTTRASSANVTLVIYDVLGKEVKTLVNKKLPAGTYSVTFDASKLTSGVYFYRMQSGNFIQTRKLLLLK